MTPLEHAEKIMALPNGRWLMVCEAISVGNSDEGGMITLQPGTKLKTLSSYTLGRAAITENAQTVNIFLRYAHAFEIMPHDATKKLTRPLDLRR